MLFVKPAFVAAALLHRSQNFCAPLNALIRRVRVSRQTARMAALLCVLTGTLLIAMVAVSIATASGAPGWLNLVVLILTWEAARSGALAVHVFLSLARLRRPLPIRVTRGSRGGMGAMASSVTRHHSR
jgi:uncharacterized membrane protein